MITILNMSAIGLPKDTVIEVVRTKKGEPAVKKEMTVAEWEGLKKQAGYHYSAFQNGYSSFFYNKEL